MKPLLKIVVLWMMLFALPLQGFAASAMSCCGSAMQAMGDGARAMSMAVEMADMETMPMDHASMIAGVDDDAKDAALSMESAGQADVSIVTPPSARHMTAATVVPDHHDMPASGTCASCAAHCASFVIASALPTVGHLPRPVSTPIPFRPIPSTTFVPGTPERPPQPALV